MYQLEVTCNVRNAQIDFVIYYIYGNTYSF